MNAKSTLLHLSEPHWQKILEYLRTRGDLYIITEARCRLFVEAILWMARSGAKWRLLPEAYGDWNKIYKRFADWSDKGIWQGLFEFMADDPDWEYVLIDSTIVRAHACASGAAKKKGRRRWAAAEAD